MGGFCVFENGENVSASFKNAMFTRREPTFSKEGFEFSQWKSVIVSRKLSDFYHKIIMFIAIGMIPFLFEQIPIGHINAPMGLE